MVQKSTGYLHPDAGDFTEAKHRSESGIKPGAIGLQHPSLEL